MPSYLRQRNPHHHERSRHLWDANVVRRDVLAAQRKSERAESEAWRVIREEGRAQRSWRARGDDGSAAEPLPAYLRPNADGARRAKEATLEQGGKHATYSGRAGLADRGEVFEEDPRAIPQPDYLAQWKDDGTLDAPPDFTPHDDPEFNLFDMAACALGGGTKKKKRKAKVNKASFSRTRHPRRSTKQSRRIRHRIPTPYNSRRRKTRRHRRR